MALNDTQLETKIIALTDDMLTKEDYASAKLEYASKLVAAIKEYLTTATVSVTGTSNQGPFTGTGTLS